MALKVLVTGAAGYVGSRVVMELLARRVSVTAVVRRAPAWLASMAGLTVIEADLCGDLTAARDNYDLIAHLAGANDVRSADASRALADTVSATRSTLELARALRVPRFLYVSTFQVYGRSTGTVRDDAPVSCANDYALTHWFAEEYVRMYARRHGFQFAIVRPTNIFGEPASADIDRWTLVPACFCREVVTTGRIVVRSSGLQSRDFISLHDVADAIAFLVTRGFGQVSNAAGILGRGTGMTIRDVALLVAARYSRRSGRVPLVLFEGTEPPTTAELTVVPAALTSSGWRPTQSTDMAPAIDRILTMSEAITGHGVQ